MKVAYFTCKHNKWKWPTSHMWSRPLSFIMCICEVGYFHLLCSHVKYATFIFYVYMWSRPLSSIMFTCEVRHFHLLCLHVKYATFIYYVYMWSTPLSSTMFTCEVGHFRRWKWPTSHLNIEDKSGLLHK
jgi:hypothetical protein